MQFSALLSEVLPWAAGFQAMYWYFMTCDPIVATYRNLSPPQKAYWSASLVSSVHSVMVVALACRAFLNNSWWLLHDFESFTVESSQCCFCFLGFIISDSILAVYFNKAWDGWETNLIHHGFVILCWTMLLLGEYAQLFALSTALMEISTPFVNLRWMLYTCGMKHLRLYTVNGVAMLLVFFLARIVGFVWMGRMLYVQRNGLAHIPKVCQIILILGWIVGFSLQLFWLEKMVRGALKTLGLIGGSPDVKLDQSPPAVILDTDTA